MGFLHVCISYTLLICATCLLTISWTAFRFAPNAQVFVFRRVSMIDLSSSFMSTDDLQSQIYLKNVDHQKLIFGTNTVLSVLKLTPVSEHYWYCGGCQQHNGIILMVYNNTKIIFDLILYNDKIKVMENWKHLKDAEI